jgi:hypothetical protein
MAATPIWVEGVVEAEAVAFYVVEDGFGFYFVESDASEFGGFDGSDYGAAGEEARERV